MAKPSKNTPKNFSITGFMKLTRFWNLLIIVMAQYFTAIFLIGEKVPWHTYFLDWRLFLLSFSTVVIAAAGYIINDYYDVKIDFINKPERVIVGKVLKRRVVMIAHTVLNFTGIVVGGFLSWKVGVVNFFSALLLWLYSNQLKRLPFIGNFSVALLTGLSVYVVHILYNGNTDLVLLYAFFAFAFTLFREIIKDMEDLKGDASFGCKTLPIIWGLRKTKHFVFLLKGIFVILLNILAFTSFNATIWVYTTTMVIPLAYIVYKIYRADTVKGFRQLSNIYKLFMLIGILSMIFI